MQAVNEDARTGLPWARSSRGPPVEYVEIEHSRNTVRVSLRPTYLFVVVAVAQVVATALCLFLPRNKCTARERSASRPDGTHYARALPHAVACAGGAVAAMLQSHAGGA